MAEVPDSASVVAQIRERVLRALSTLRGWDALSWVLCVATIVVPCWVVVGPWFQDTSTYGFHDWDVQTSHRFLVKRSLLQYGEFPGWNPYACGGFPAWGYVESGTIVVSPWLPLYLFMDIRTALRVEVLGMALAGAAGTYALAGRFTESRGARAVVVALFAVNGRWALQAAAGHTWHLAYALMPWAWWAFERARTRPASFRHLVGLGIFLALLVYAGGIYPLPHTVLLLGLWAIGVAIVEKSPRPVAILAAGGAIGVGLSAPKLFPLLSTFDRAPRLIASNETLSVGGFVTLLTSRAQAFYERPADLRPYGWHEWGMYISLVGALGLAIAFVIVGGKREAVLKVVAAIFLTLGFGAFHELAPWKLLHEHAPVFRSQHVPSRFLYPAVLISGLVLASGLGAIVARARRRFAGADAVLAALALALALDVASVAQKPMRDAMWMRAPTSIPSDRSFRFTKSPPFHYVKRDWAGPMYLAMVGNTGVIDCYGAPPFDGKGALASRDPGYQGEVFTTEGGRASIVTWSPNSAEVDVTGAREGARMVYNMNYDAGWRATVRGEDRQDRPAVVVADADRVSVVVPSGASRVRVWYRPPGLFAGLGTALATLIALVLVGRARRRSGVEE